MKKILLILIYLLTVYNAPGATNEDIDIDNIIIHENRFDRLIDLAKSFMDINPEFAFNCAYKANEIANQTNNLKESATSFIIMGDIFNSYGSPVNAIPYYEKSLENMYVYNDFKSMHEMFMKLSRLYSQNDLDIYKSIDYLKRAIQFAVKTNCVDCFLEANVELGDVYFLIDDYNSANACYDVVLNHNSDKPIYKYIAIALTSKSRILIKQKQYESALRMIDSSLNLCNYYSDMNLAIDNYAFKAEIYDSLNIAKETNYYYEQAIRLAYENKEYEDCGQFMYNYGLHEIRHNNIDKAIDVLKILCDSTETFRWFDICYLSYYQLSKCYAQMDNYEEAYHLFNKYDIIYDSAVYAKQEQVIDKLNTVHYLSMNIEEKKSKELELANEKNRRTNKIFTSTIILVLCIVLVTVVILYSRHKILYYKNLEMSYMQQMRIDKMESELMEIQLRNDKEMLVNLALHLKSYIESIDFLRKELKDVVDSSETEQKNKIKNVYLNLQNNGRLSANVQNISKQINEIYKDFLDRLERLYPDLTKTEKRLCAMLYVNMSSKEIAVITNTTIRSVETSRYRLRKKFNLLRDDDMVEFLRKI